MILFIITMYCTQMYLTEFNQRLTFLQQKLMFIQQGILEYEQQRNEELLLSMLPRSIIEQVTRLIVCRWWVL